MNVLALVPYPTGRVPGQRYRLEQWAPLLARAGVHVDFQPFLDGPGLERLHAPGGALGKALAVAQGFARRLKLLRGLDAYQAAYVYREAALLGSTAIERRVARRLPLVFDFDDAIYLQAISPGNAAFAWLKRPGKTAELCALARHVMVGNDHLAAFAREHAAAVTVVPSTVDTDVYRPRGTQAGPRPIVGWTGSATTAPYLEALLPALVRLRERADFQLRVIGARPALPGLDVQVLPWRAESEVQDLLPVDVGLMPLPDDAWSQGKCGMKALQYMGLGIPPVVSPVGANRSIVEHGRNGMHASSDDEWVAHLFELLHDPALRARLGAAGRATIDERFSARVQAPRVQALFEQAAR